jgi:hypothetical protein
MLAEGPAETEPELETEGVAPSDGIRLLAIDQVDLVLC